MAQTNPDNEQPQNEFTEIARELDPTLIELQLKQFSKSKHTAITKIITAIKNERTTATDKVVVFSSENVGRRIIVAKMFANELGLPLYLFDLPMALSDEDEDLNALLTAAADIEGVLLIDDSDVLFGTDTDSEVATDLSIEDLLKVVENAKGVIILTCKNYKETPIAETKTIKYALEM